MGVTFDGSKNPTHAWVTIGCGGNFSFDESTFGLLGRGGTSCDCFELCDLTETEVVSDSWPSRQWVVTTPERDQDVLDDFDDHGDEANPLWEHVGACLKRKKRFQNPNRDIWCQDELPFYQHRFYRERKLANRVDTADVMCHKVHENSPEYCITRFMAIRMLKQVNQWKKKN